MSMFFPFRTQTAPQTPHKRRMIGWRADASNARPTGGANSAGERLKGASRSHATRVYDRLEYLFRGGSGYNDGQVLTVPAMKLRSLLRPLACFALATTLASCGGGGGGGDETATEQKVTFKGLFPEGYDQVTMALTLDGSQVLKLTLNGTAEAATGDITSAFGSIKATEGQSPEETITPASAKGEWEQNVPNTDNQIRLYELSGSLTSDIGKKYTYEIYKLYVKVEHSKEVNGELVFEGNIADMGDNPYLQVQTADGDTPVLVAKYKLSEQTVTLTYSKSAGK